MLERKLQKARAVLGVPVEATRADIKMAYLLLVKKYHPDCTGEAFDALAAGDVDVEDSQYTLEAMRKAKDLLYKALPGHVS